MSANERQVGGDHYRKSGGEQHWDRLVRIYGWPGARPYFAGNISAYVERYHEKNGIQDLEKARHYLDKLIELETEHAPKSEGKVDEQPPSGAYGSEVAKGGG